MLNTTNACLDACTIDVLLHHSYSKARLHRPGVPHPWRYRTTPLARRRPRVWCTATAASSRPPSCLWTWCEPCRHGRRTCGRCHVPHRRLELPTEVRVAQDEAGHVHPGHARGGHNWQRGWELRALRAQRHRPTSLLRAPATKTSAPTPSLKVTDKKMMKWWH